MSILLNCSFFIIIISFIVHFHFNLRHLEIIFLNYFMVFRLLFAPSVSDLFNETFAEYRIYPWNCWRKATKLAKLSSSFCCSSFFSSSRSFFSLWFTIGERTLVERIYFAASSSDVLRWPTMDVMWVTIYGLKKETKKKNHHQIVRGFISVVRLTKSRRTQH